MWFRAQGSAWHMAASKPVHSFALRSPIFCNWLVNRPAGCLAPYWWSVGMHFLGTIFVFMAKVIVAMGGQESSEPSGEM